MKKLELRQLIRQCINEAKDEGYTPVKKTSKKVNSAKSVKDIKASNGGPKAMKEQGEEEESAPSPENITITLPIAHAKALHDILMSAIEAAEGKQGDEEGGAPEAPEAPQAPEAPAGEEEGEE